MNNSNAFPVFTSERSYPFFDFVVRLIRLNQPEVPILVGNSFIAIQGYNKSKCIKSYTPLLMACVIQYTAGLVTDGDIVVVVIYDLVYFDSFCLSVGSFYMVLCISNLLSCPRVFLFFLLFHDMFTL